MSEIATNFLGKNGRVLIACALFLMLSIRPFAGLFGLIFAVPVFFWLIYSVLVIASRPAQRKPQSIKVGIWLLTGVAFFVAHWYYRETARHGADAVVLGLQQYKAVHGTYPRRLEMIGQAGSRLQKELRLYYRYQTDDATLLYLDTFDPMDKFFYDFRIKAWVRDPD